MGTWHVYKVYDHLLRGFLLTILRCKDMNSPNELQRPAQKGDFECNLQNFEPGSSKLDKIFEVPTVPLNFNELVGRSNGLEITRNLT